MKVCIIAGNYATSNDGIGRYTRNIVQQLESKKIEVDLVPKIQIMHSQNVVSNSSKRNLVPTFLKGPITAMLVEWHYFKRFRESHLSLQKELQAIDADIYHAISPSEAVAAVKSNKIPLITTFHDIIPLLFEKRFLMEKIYFQRYVQAAKKSDLILADSQHTKDDLQKYLKIPEHRIEVVYPGINTDRFHPKSHKPRPEKIILYQGGLLKRKGVYEALYAFSKVCAQRKDVKMQIGGTGNEYHALQLQVKKLGLRDQVEFLGFVTDEKLVDYYNNADLFVYPSKYEGFGYTPLEAMACGVPILTSNTSSIPEVVGDAAITVDPYDIDAIAMHMNKILDDDSLQKQLRHKGPLQAAKFNTHNCIKKIQEVYQSML
jgi:glycosyltransferase involved in cell wall biosynthesis